MLGAVVVFLILSGGAAGAVHVVEDVVERGARLTTSTIGQNGLVNESPALLLAQACAALGRDITQEAYALARMARSEADPRDGDENRRWRMWTARNDGDAHGWSVFQTVTAATGGGHVYGGQIPGRRYSTARDPYESDLVLAEQVLSADWSEDPTGGAVKFADPGALGGVQPGTPSYAALVDRWGAEGLTPEPLNGPGGTVFFRKVA